MLINGAGNGADIFLSLSHFSSAPRNSPPFFCNQFTCEKKRFFRCCSLEFCRSTAFSDASQKARERARDREKKEKRKSNRAQKLRDAIASRRSERSADISALFVRNAAFVRKKTFLQILQISPRKTSRWRSPIFRQRDR